MHIKTVETRVIKMTRAECNALHDTARSHWPAIEGHKILEWNNEDGHNYMHLEGIKGRLHVVITDSGC